MSDIEMPFLLARGRCARVAGVVGLVVGQGGEMEDVGHVDVDAGGHVCGDEDLQVALFSAS